MIKFPYKIFQKYFAQWNLTNVIFKHFILTKIIQFGTIFVFHFHNFFKFFITSNNTVLKTKHKIIRKHFPLKTNQFKIIK